MSFDAALVRLVEALREADAPDGPGLDRILRQHPKGGKGFFRRSEILAAYRALAPARGWRDEAAFVERLRLRPVRTLSGVAAVTVLTEPYPCPGRCSFCPSDVRMPKSYLADEPGAQRAEANAFDAYRQTWSRLAAYRATGHALDKVELIVLGGTFAFYPEAYRVAFVRDCLRALDDFGRGVDGREARPAGLALRAEAARAAGDPRRRSYNRLVSRALRGRRGGRLRTPETADWAGLAAAQAANETAACRCVGLSVETRPDWCDAEEVLRLRRLGVTKVQLGVQSLDDAVLRANARGHDAAASRAALTRLRRAGFKLQVHWMPNLLGATPAGDRRDVARLWSDPALRPDEVKLYPCSLVADTALMEAYRAGRWQPYPREALVALLADALAGVPRWCRVTRIIRDISSDDIVAGNRNTNLREVVERALAERGVRPVEIRAREVRGRSVDPGALRLRETAYATAIGEDRFLELVTAEDQLAGFLRLALPRTPAPLPELEGRALVREVHVYGAVAALGTRDADRAQHRGLGRRLVARAARRAAEAGFAGLAVISAVGTRGWYRRLGFRDGPLYQHLPLEGATAVLEDAAATGEGAAAALSAQA